MKRVYKKGLSPVIASVLLILLVIVLASLIFFWAKGFVGEQVEKFGGNIELACESVNFDVALSSDGDNIEIVNRGNVDIFSFNIKIDEGDGNSGTSDYDYRVDKGSSISEVRPVDTGEATFFPVIIGKIQGENSNKVFTCIDAGKTITI